MRIRLLLQLFAKQNTTSNSTTTTNESSQGGSESSTVGGSTSHSEGGSHSETSSHSETNSHSEGGAHGESRGVQYASGEVEDNTRARRDTYNTDYAEGQKVSDAYKRLQDTIDNKPGFQSTYEDKLNSLYDQIMNREAFSYNFNADPMYQLYKDQYTQSGKRAMEDTIGQASALTGGYGNSYAQSVGQQTYQNYLNDVNNMIPELRNQAYQQYMDEGQQLLNQYNITGDAYNREYGQYRDQVADWQADRSFDYGNYSDERSFDYNQFANERNYWNQEYWNERNSAYSNEQSSDESNWNDTHSVTNAWSTTDEQHWEDAVSSFWENTNSSNWSNGTGVTNTNSYSATSSIPSGSGTTTKNKATDWSGLKTTSMNENAVNSYTPLSDAERKARFGGAFTTGIDTGTEAGKSIQKAYDSLPWTSSLKDSKKREDILSNLYSTQNNTLPDVLEDLTDKYDLTDKELDAISQWLRYMRG